MYGYSFRLACNFYLANDHESALFEVFNLDYINELFYGHIYRVAIQMYLSNTLYKIARITDCISIRFQNLDSVDILTETNLEISKWWETVEHKSFYENYHVHVCLFLI